MSSSPRAGDCIIVLDEDSAPSPPPPPPPVAQRERERERSPGPSGPARPLNGRPEQKGPAGLRAENERLFEEFVVFCSKHTGDHPEVISYLSGRHQKTNPEYLASVEFHNVLSRCLTRVQARTAKIYVYINELCTTFRAHSQKKRAVATPVSVSETPPEPAKPCMGSKRQIRYLENLLRVYADEIRQLQERELDLAELDSADSAYLQESRLKQRLMRVFKLLCRLKDCDSLTGRVIEQRIPYCGTRYPEVNRRIERLINQPEAFPDFADILKVVQKASARHSLGLPKRQMEIMAADAFRDVGASLQKRRRLDLIYNFGSHLTDQYQPNSDPALADRELAQRLQRNQELAEQRLEQVISRFAQLQDKSEEEEDNHQQGGRRPRPDGGGVHTGPSGAAGATEGEPASPRESIPGAAAREDSAGPEETSKKKAWEEEEEEEEEESSESDIEAELANCLDGGDEEEEEAAAAAAAAAVAAPGPDEDPPATDAEADQHMDLEVPEVVLYSSTEEEEEGEDQEEEGLAAFGDSTSQQFLLEIEEVLPLEDQDMPPPSPSPPLQEEQEPACPTPKGTLPPKRSRSLENGELSAQPPHKRSRWQGRHLVPSSGSCIEVPSSGSEGEEEERPRLLPPRSPAPLADSTHADSPGLGLVTSTQGSLPPAPQQQWQQELLSRTSVATQCDPEEIIILSDSE